MHTDHSAEANLEQTVPFEPSPGWSEATDLEGTVMLRPHRRGRDGPTEESAGGAGSDISTHFSEVDASALEGLDPSELAQLGLELHRLESEDLGDEASDDFGFEGEHTLELVAGSLDTLEAQLRSHASDHDIRRCVQEVAEAELASRSESGLAPRGRHALRQAGVRELERRVAGSRGRR